MHYTLPRQVSVPKSNTDQQFGIVKAFQRIWIQDRHTGMLLYTHPDFVKLINRAHMQVLADAANTRGTLHINDIVVFESSQPRASGYSKNTRIGQ
jgi:hypothetical protein